MAKTIQCSNCGATDLSKLNDTEYKCNYCQARVVTENPKIDFGSFFKTLNPNDLHQRTHTTYYSEKVIKKNTSRLGCIIAFAILLGLAAGIVPIILTIKSNTSPDFSNPAGWALFYTPQVYYTVGSKGPAVWIFREENYDWKKNRTVLNIVDPVSGKTLHTETVIREHNSNETVPSVWDLYNGGKVFGDTIFFTPKGKGLEGRNIYTAKKLVDQAYFNKTIGSELAEANAYTTLEDPYIRVKSAEGNDYYYFPGKNRLITREVYNKEGNDNKIYKYFFILSGDNDKKAVFRILQLTDANDKTGTFSHSYKEYKEDGQYYTKYYNVKSVDSIPVNHGFFGADILWSNDSVFVIKYKSNLMDNAPWTIGSFNLSGKNLWKVVPAQMDVFKTKDQDKKMDPDVLIMHDQLVITVNSGTKAACGVDLHKGKITWTLKTDK